MIKSNKNSYANHKIFDVIYEKIVRCRGGWRESYLICKWIKCCIKFKLWGNPAEENCHIKAIWNFIRGVLQSSDGM